MSKVIFTAILFCILIVFPVLLYGGQVVIDSGVQFKLAESLYKQGDYNEAALEYMRFYHLFPSHENVLMARYKTGVSFFRADRLTDAKRHFAEIASDFSDSEGYAPKAMFALSDVYMAMDRVPDAINTLSNLVTLTTDTKLKDRALQKLAWLILKNAEELAARSDYRINPYQRAAEYLAMVSDTAANNNQIKGLLADLESMEDLQQKHPFIAGLSAIIPGGGFLYCERYRDAATAFLFNSAMILGAYESFRNDQPFLGSAVAFVETGFYAGNIYGSVSSAHKYNRKKKKQMIRDLEKKYRPGQYSMSFSGAPLKNGFVVTFNFNF